ncbi:hypothetical protein [Modestobacter sp. VKM Ac-2985]|uniref:hypothetical protein n=1 Tax=Modestobacter sp. VKM Ac-2985 TaxID=3004139 RepID=UPI0022AB5037|nr:hypothetical protein [Modestobacter sp. VKM Ac-2985]MCZ2838217.1 hypothetical protein [Modestobacter sp. VKM Ac-2985]
MKGSLPTVDVLVETDRPSVLRIRYGSPLVIDLEVVPSVGLALAWVVALLGAGRGGASALVKFRKDWHEGSTMKIEAQERSIGVTERAEAAARSKSAEADLAEEQVRTQSAQTAKLEAEADEIRARLMSAATDDAATPGLIAARETYTARFRDGLEARGDHGAYRPGGSIWANNYVERAVEIGAWRMGESGLVLPDVAVVKRPAGPASG